MNRVMSVSQLARYLKGVFDDEELLHDVTLNGEVTDISYSDRHTFLVIAEGVYSVRCVHFSSRDNIEKGARVSLRGSVDFYDKKSAVSFTYDRFTLQGVGDKNARLAENKQKLAELGYFENRPTLPRYIADVVAITSQDGAAIRDFIRVVHDKNPFVSIRVYPVKVQGEGAAVQMTEAVKRLQCERTDAIVLCRGGGSDDDLDSFNDFELAKAVALSHIPVISAVGHEINYSLCDYCAGTRAGTPSIAGEIVNAHAGMITSDIAYLTERMRVAVADISERCSMRIARLGNSAVKAATLRVMRERATTEYLIRRGMYKLKDKLAAKRTRLEMTAKELKINNQKKYTARRAATEKLMAMFFALDPHRIIKIGYAAVAKSGMRVMNAAELGAGDSVKLIFADGSATAEITDVCIEKTR